MRRARDTVRTRVFSVAEKTDGCAELRIHEETERGDNDSVKMAGIGSSVSGECCSSR